MIQQTKDMKYQSKYPQGKGISQVLWTIKCKYPQVDLSHWQWRGNLLGRLCKLLTHFGLNKLHNTIYWMSQILILGMSDYVI